MSPKWQEKHSSEISKDEAQEHCKNSSKWFSPRSKVKNWNIFEQFKNISEKFGDLPINPDRLAESPMEWLTAVVPSPTYLPGYEADYDSSS